MSEPTGGSHAIVCTECSGERKVGMARTVPWGRDGFIMASVAAPCPKCMPKQFKEWKESQ